MIRGLIKRIFRRETASTYTKEEALQIGRYFLLEREIKEALRCGLSPDEALEEWDIYPYGGEPNNNRRIK